MIYRGRFRTVRHKDHAVPTPLPRPLLGQSSLDIRAWRRAEDGEPLLLVTSPRKTGGAVQRNRFRRQVRMAFLAQVETLLGGPWVVWVRPGRSAPPLGTIRFQDIENQLRLALNRLPASDAP
ncbi:ribonuclease P protein component [Geothrix sp. PMB-07]|uniref:ribonuclease P protein component n=1 Tax=Geothrix sp. PMB-07 TaxID=3068640 RepID=UPI002742240F|nr:ribonuclease P protein component [Geothrix sp. PMB-07]WLT31713.1 ribonuclease P protein component [Geothrix sp. PMB-07]